MQHLWLQRRRCRSFDAPPRAFPAAARGTRGTRGTGVQVQLTDGLDRRPKSWGRSWSWWEPWQNWPIGRKKASKYIKKDHRISQVKVLWRYEGVHKLSQTQLRANLATNCMHSSFLRPLDPNFFDDIPFRPCRWQGTLQTCGERFSRQEEEIAEKPRQLQCWCRQSAADAEKWDYSQCLVARKFLCADSVHFEYIFKQKFARLRIRLKASSKTKVWSYIK